MRKVGLFSSVIVLAITVLCLASSAQVPPGAVTQEPEVVKFRGEIDELKVIFYHVRGESAGFVVMDADGDLVAQVKKEPRLWIYKGTGVYDVTGDGWPEIVLVNQAGGKTLEAVIYTYESGSLHELWWWSGWNFQVVKLGNRPVIAIIPRQTGTLTKLIAWEKGRFLEVSERFPGFFSEEVEVQLRTLNSSYKLPYYVFVQACELGARALLYGKNYAKATSMCQQAIEIVLHSERVIPNQRHATPEAFLQERKEGEQRIRKILLQIKEAQDKGLLHLPSVRESQ